jgi:hypothetical protein
MSKVTAMADDNYDEDDGASTTKSKRWKGTTTRKKNKLLHQGAPWCVGLSHTKGDKRSINGMRDKMDGGGL